MGIVINSCVTGLHGMCLYSYLLCMHTLSTMHTHAHAYIRKRK